MMNESWTIAELAELAAEALAPPGTFAAAGQPGSGEPDGEPDGGPESSPVRANGRVRDVPNERLIRWYGTVGLVDPPLSRRGRVARYGRRHLLQLVAVKRRQAEGKSLAQIQAELAGATDEALAAVARVPALRPAPSLPGAAAPGGTEAGPGRFWARQPRQPAEAATAGTDTAAGVPAAGFVHGIRLAPGVLLLLDGADREPGPRDLTAIVNAARPLLTELASRGLGAPTPRAQAEIDHPKMGAENEH
jgi:MerR HTH family regulatory protein